MTSNEQALCAIAVRKERERIAAIIRETIRTSVYWRSEADAREDLRLILDAVEKPK